MRVLIVTDLEGVNWWQIVCQHLLLLILSVQHKRKVFAVVIFIIAFYIENNPPDHFHNFGAILG